MIPNWKPISGHDGYFGDGDRFLVAIRVHNSRTNKTNWEYHQIRVSCDSESPVEFYYDLDELLGESVAFTDWQWDDLEYYIKIED